MQRNHFLSENCNCINTLRLVSGSLSFCLLHLHTFTADAFIQSDVHGYTLSRPLLIHSSSLVIVFLFLWWSDRSPDQFSLRYGYCIYSQRLGDRSCEMQGFSEKRWKKQNVQGCFLFILLSGCQLYAMLIRRLMYQRLANAKPQWGHPIVLYIHAVQTWVCAGLCVAIWTLTDFCVGNINIRILNKSVKPNFTNQNCRRGLFSGTAYRSILQPKRFERKR